MDDSIRHHQQAGDQDIIRVTCQYQKMTCSFPIRPSTATLGLDAFLIRKINDKITEIITPLRMPKTNTPTNAIMAMVNSILLR